VGDASKNVRNSLDGAFLLSAYPPPSYYHWILNYLPKIEAYEYYREQTGRNPPIIVPDSPEEWRIEALEHVGYSKDDFFKWDDGPNQIERLVIPSHRNRTPDPRSFTPSMGDCRWVRHRVMENVEEEGHQFSSRVYLSRRDALMRRVVNEGAVEELLGEYGFETYALGEMSFSTGVQLFEQADVVVGPHGGGFVNLLFADSIRFLEFMPENRVLGGFLCLACQLGHEYHHLICRSKDDDIHVNVSQLATKLDGMGL
jgi:prepilin-type processing-associated H-X9-DG protein